jgi:hypothetical protein
MAVKRWNGTAWEVYAGADLAPVKVTDGRVGKTTFIGAASPTGQVDGDIWIDQDTVTNAVVPTALTTKGDTFVATGNAAYTRLAAGSNGESLFADSSTSTGLRWQGDFNTGKNKIINGDFAINQRGFVSSNVQANTYMADRFFYTSSGTGPATFSIEQFPVGTMLGNTTPKQYLRVVTSGQSGSTVNTLVRQIIENVGLLAGQTVTISFWAKCASGNAKIALSGDQQFGTGGSPSSRVREPIGQLTLSTSWERKSITYTIPSINGKIIGTDPNTSFWSLFFYFSAGSNEDSFSGSLGIQSNTFDVWGLQVEIGSVATPFTTATGTIQGELAACQRYYIQTVGEEASGTIYNSGGAAFFVKFPVQMRVSPSASFPTVLTSSIDEFGIGARTPTSIVSNRVSTRAASSYATGMSGLTVGVPCVWIGGSIAYSAEF